jgi:transposase-like protein
MTATPTFIALTDLPNLRAAGIVYPSTVHGWRWLFRHRHERGLEDAFRRIGRRIVVDAQRYQELLRELRRLTEANLLTENPLVHSLYDVAGLRGRQVHIAAYHA